MVFDYSEYFVSQNFLTKTWFRNNICLGITNHIVQTEITCVISMYHHQAYKKTKNKTNFNNKN